ncbi:MAG TPA: aminotransferase class V-fold PLP-dependent enzyme [Gemmatimonadales bacterium]
MTVASSRQIHPLAHYRDEFPIFGRQIYLNSCSLGALSRRSRRWVERYLDEWEARGASAWYDTWMDRLGALREGYAAVIGASGREIALHASVSSATAVLASTLDYHRRPKVVTTELDFPTVVYQWLAKRPLGIDLVVVASPDGVTVPPEAIAAVVDDRTALVATSHVYFTTGAVQDIAAVADVAHARGALCFIDAYQSVGQIPMDVQETGVDFLSAGGLKWLLGGPGITFLYAREDLLSTLQPTVTGWFANERQFGFDPRSLVLHDDARRLELGTPALGAVHAQLGGLEVIREIGVPVIRQVVSDLTTDLVARATESGLRPRAADRAEDRSAIVMIPFNDPVAEVARLAAAGIVADARPGHVRLSPFFYNLVDDHVAALEVLTR